MWSYQINTLDSPDLFSTCFRDCLMHDTCRLVQPSIYIIYPQPNTSILPSFSYMPSFSYIRCNKTNNIAIFILNSVSHSLPVVCCVYNDFTCSICNLLAWICTCPTMTSPTELWSCSERVPRGKLVWSSDMASSYFLTVWYIYIFHNRSLEIGGCSL